MNRYSQAVRALKRSLGWVFCSMPFMAAVAATSDPAIPSPSPSWHAQSLGQALGYMVLFAVVGIALAIAGYKLFDQCTPGSLDREILENKNVAAAIVAAAVILGVCIIIAAAMLG